MVNWDGQYAVFKCRAVTAKGDFVGYGTANHQRDARLAESLIELAETRSIARAFGSLDTVWSTAVQRKSAMWETPNKIWSET